MAESIPNNSDNSEIIEDNPAESPAAEPAESAAKKRGRPKGAADKAPRAPKKKAVVVEEPIHKEPEKPPEPEKTPEKPKRTRAPRPKTEAAPQASQPSRGRPSSSGSSSGNLPEEARPTPTEAREPDPPSPRTTLRDAAHHILQLQSLRANTRRTHLADAYTRNLR